MTRYEAAKKWKMLRDNYEILRVFFSDDAEVMNTLVPDLKLLEFTIAELEKDTGVVANE